MIAKFETLPDTRNGLVHQLVVQADDAAEEVALDLWIAAFLADYAPRESQNCKALLLIRRRLPEFQSA
jgi:hypothetical protein